MAVDMTTMLGGGAVAGVFIAAWEHIKVYLSKIYGLFFVRIHTDDRLKNAVTLWLCSKCVRSRITVLTFYGKTNFVKPVNKTQLIAYEVPSNEPTIYFYGKIPLLVSDNGCNITFLRWTVNYNVIMQEILDCFNDKMSDGLDAEDKDRFYIRKFNGSIQTSKNSNFRDIDSDSLQAVQGKTRLSSLDGDFDVIAEYLPLVKWKKNDIGQPKRPDPISYLALSKECENAIEDLKMWRRSENWYKDRFIPWKKGILCYGKAGCGKSSLAKSLAMELNMPIMIFNITDMTNTDFQRAWDQTKNTTPCIVLLEDIDAVFDGRKNIAHTDGGLSFDCLLNCIDGVEQSDGILIIVTTNNVDKIDIALGKPNGDNISTRPGRIDRALELCPPDKNGRMKIAKRILADYPDEIDKIVEDGINDTGAQFQERCSRLALKIFWKK